MTARQQRPSLAVAISLYDRWDELQGLLELLRLNWPTGPNLKVIVSSTAEEVALPAWVERSYVDNFLWGSRYSLPARRSSRLRPLHDRRYGFFKQQLRTRTLDSISRGCRVAAASGQDYTLHLHAAAWPLLENVIYDILAKMTRKNYLFAARGYGQKYVDGKHPDGDIDDNFFLINNSFAHQTNFWDFDAACDADRIGNEGRLARRVYELCGDDQVYFYEDFSRPEEYIYPAEADQRRVQPYNYHKPTGLLRSHDMSWQAKLCAELGYHGPFLDRLIAQELGKATVRQSASQI